MHFYSVAELQKFFGSLHNKIVFPPHTWEFSDEIKIRFKGLIVLLDSFQSVWFGFGFFV